MLNRQFFCLALLFCFVCFRVDAQQGNSSIVWVGERTVIVNEDQLFVNNPIHSEKIFISEGTVFVSDGFQSFEKVLMVSADGLESVNHSKVKIYPKKRKSRLRKSTIAHSFRAVETRYHVGASSNVFSNHLLLGYSSFSIQPFQYFQLNFIDRFYALRFTIYDDPISHYFQPIVIIHCLIGKYSVRPPTVIFSC